MKRFFVNLSVFFAVVLVVYNLWAVLGRADEKKTGWSKPPEIKTHFPETSLGTDSNRGNIIGIQPWLSPQSYATALNFNITLRLHIAQLQREKLLGAKTILVFPGHIGSWLLAVNEKQDIYDDSSMQHAFHRMAWSNLFKFGWQWLRANGQADKTTYALFCMKGKKMAEIYQQTFSELAKTFGVTIVAGSILLPAPSLDKSGNLVTGTGNLYNTTAVFGPDGNILPPLVLSVCRSRPEDKEPGPPALSLFTTPAGKMAVSGSSGNLNPDTYTAFKDKAGMILLPAEPAKAGSHSGMVVFFTGNMWNAKTEGAVVALRNDSASYLPAPPGRGMMVNLWLR